MSLLPIRVDDDPVLRLKAKRIGAIDASVRRLAADMLETMRDANGVGLAAPQVGVSLRLIVVEVPEDLDEGEVHYLYTLVNPEVVKASGEQIGDEGCLSLPGWVAEVRRAESVTVKGRGLDGKELRVKASGLLARALQHEIDHLDGVLFTDRVEDVTTIRHLQPRESEESTAVLHG